MVLPLAELVRRFEAPVELGEAWTHPAQLALAAWYLRTYPRVEAEERHRRHLTAYLALCGASQRYHETRTAAWFELISQELVRHGDDAPLDVVTADLVLRYPDGRALHRFWSEAAINSEAARHGWVEPDLGPVRLPDYCTTSGSKS